MSWTDEPSFQGSLAYLEQIRAVVSAPLLRKDFLIDRYQLLEARVAGADAVLLIAEILDDTALSFLQREAAALGMQALVELYDRANLARVLDSGARLIGVNNRDLRSFATRLEHTLDLAALMPADVCLVSESGIRNRADLDRLKAHGVRAVLVGETLMRADDIGRQLDELRGVHLRLSLVPRAAKGTVPLAIHFVAPPGLNGNARLAAVSTTHSNRSRTAVIGNSASDGAGPSPISSGRSSGFVAAKP